jgi:hypothetical protein
MAVSSSAISTILICITVPSLLRWLYSSSSKQAVEEEGASLVFPAASKIIAVIRWSGVALGTVFLASTPWTLDKPVAIVTCTMIGLVFLGMSFLCRAIPVVLTAEGISGPSVWSQGNFIPWSQVKQIEFNKGNQVTKVIGISGTKIYHSGFHAAPERFRQELKQRTHLPIKVVEPGALNARISYE